MFSGRVSLMTGEIVQGVDTVIFHHQPVSSDLCYDGGRSDRRTPSVTLFDSLLGDVEGKEVDPVDKKEIGKWVKAQDCFLHCPDGGLQDVVLFDVPRAHNPHSPGEGASGNDVICVFSLSRGEEFGVPHTGNLIPCIDDNCCRHHRASQWASPRLIHPRHPAITLGSEPFFLRHLVGVCWMALVHSRAAIVFL